jgi:hypothetical protein
MTASADILTLAEGGGFEQFIGFILLAVVGIVVSIAKKVAERKAEQQAEAKPRTFRAARATTNQAATDENGWIEVAPPPARRTPLRRTLQDTVGNPHPESLWADQPGESPHIRPAEAAPGPERRHVAVDLSSSQTTQGAMIFHEIFSPPKALRQDADPWER